MKDLGVVLSSLVDQRTALELGTSDLCFLVALQDRLARAGTTSLGEDELLDLYEQVCELSEPQASNPRKRATHALTRLREQRLLGRIDGSGLVQSGQYSPTILARAIADFYVSAETLTRENLNVLTLTLRAELLDIKRAAQEGSPLVTTRLQVTVAELVSGIEHRQQGLDAQQQEVRQQIGELLRQDWFAAIEGCEALLATTTATLAELNEVLLRESGSLLDLLEDIAQLAAEHEQPEAELAAHDASAQVERMKAWGRDRQAAWSDYFQYVQRFLRTVVRLDPDRAVSQRLRDGLGAWPETPYYFWATEAEPLWERRELNARPVLPPVEQPRRERETPLAAEPPVARPQLDELVRAAMEGGARTLSEVLDSVLPHFPDVYRSTGRVAEALTRVTRVRSEREREWVRVQQDLEVEQWSLPP